MLQPVVAVVLIIAVAACFMANRRALAMAGGRSSELHSRPGYHASLAALPGRWAGAGALGRLALLEPACCATSSWARRQPTSRAKPRARRLLHERGATSCRWPAARRRGDPACRRPRTTGQLLSFAGSRCWRPGRAGGVLRLGACGIASATSAPATPSSAGHRGTGWPPASRSRDHGRHRPLGAVRDRCASSSKVPLSEFLFGLQWSPQTALRADQVGSSGAFGAVPLFAGTLLITRRSRCWWPSRSACSRRSTCRNMPSARLRAPGSSRSWRSWPASRPWSTASSQR